MKKRGRKQGRREESKPVTNSDDDVDRGDGATLSHHGNVEEVILRLHDEQRRFARQRHVPLGGVGWGDDPKALWDGIIEYMEKAIEDGW